VLAVPSLVNYTLAFALQLREKHGKTSVRVAKEIQSIHMNKTPAHYKTHPYNRIRMELQFILILLESCLQNWHITLLSVQ
jgi:hypothetical protein